MLEWQFNSKNGVSCLSVCLSESLSVYNLDLSDDCMSAFSLFCSSVKQAHGPDQEFHQCKAWKSVVQQISCSKETLETFCENEFGQVVASWSSSSHSLQSILTVWVSKKIYLIPPPDLNLDELTSHQRQARWHLIYLSSNMQLVFLLYFSRDFWWMLTKGNLSTFQDWEHSSGNIWRRVFSRELESKHIYKGRKCIANGYFKNEEWMFINDQIKCRSNLACLTLLSML